MRARPDPALTMGLALTSAAWLAGALAGCGPTERSAGTSSAPRAAASPERSTAAARSASPSAAAPSSEPSGTSSASPPGPAPSAGGVPAAGALACGVFTAKFERVSTFQSVELFVPKSSAQLGPGLTWSATCVGPAAPPGCMALRPSGWEAAPRAALVEDATVDVGVDGTPRIVALVRTRMPPHSCYVLATLGLDGAPISGALLQGAIGAPRVTTGEGMIGLRMFVARDEDPSAGAGAYPAFVLAFATATPPTLEVQSLAVSGDGLGIRPLTLGSKLVGGATPDERVGSLARVDTGGASGSAVGDRLVVERDGEVVAFDVAGAKVVLHSPAAPDKVMFARANASWIVWVARRGEDLVAFASRYARSSEGVAPVELGVLTDAVEVRDPFGERIALGPRHVAIGADLFRLEDGARASLTALPSGAGEQLRVAGVTATDLYWNERAALQRVPIGGLTFTPRTRP